MDIRSLSYKKNTVTPRIEQKPFLVYLYKIKNTHFKVSLTLCVNHLRFTEQTPYYNPAFILSNWRDSEKNLSDFNNKNNKKH